MKKRKKLLSSHHAPYLAIASIVAIIAVIFLIINYTPSREALAGAARYQAAPQVQLPSGSQQQLGVVLAPDMKLLSKSEIESKLKPGFTINPANPNLNFQVEDPTYLKNAAEICKHIGYSGCLAAEVQEICFPESYTNSDGWTVVKFLSCNQACIQLIGGPAAPGAKPSYCPAMPDCKTSFGAMTSRGGHTVSELVGILCTN